jgi:hypothetical protein
MTSSLSRTRSSPLWANRGERLLPARGEKVAEGRMRGSTNLQGWAPPLTLSLSPHAGRGDANDWHLHFS